MFPLPLFSDVEVDEAGGMGADEEKALVVRLYVSERSTE